MSSQGCPACYAGDSPGGWRCSGRDGCVIYSVIYCADRAREERIQAAREAVLEAVRVEHAAEQAMTENRYADGYVYAWRSARDAYRRAAAILIAAEAEGETP